MEFKTIEGDKPGSKLFETGDHHIYRTSGGGGGSPYLSCYLSCITKIMLKTNPHAEKCPGKTDNEYGIHMHVKLYQGTGPLSLMTSDNFSHVQGETSGCSQGSGDIKTKVPF